VGVVVDTKEEEMSLRRISTLFIEKDSNLHSKRNSEHMRPEPWNL
jgi:hypothetical protein